MDASCFTLFISPFLILQLIFRNDELILSSNGKLDCKNNTALIFRNYELLLSSNGKLDCRNNMALIFRNYELLLSSNGKLDCRNNMAKIRHRCQFGAVVRMRRRRDRSTADAYALIDDTLKQQLAATREVAETTTAQKDLFEKERVSQEGYWKTQTSHMKELETALCTMAESVKCLLYEPRTTTVNGMQSVPHPTIPERVAGNDEENQSTNQVKEKDHAQILTQKIAMVLGGFSAALYGLMRNWDAKHLDAGGKHDTDGGKSLWNTDYLVWSACTFALASYLVMARIAAHYQKSNNENPSKSAWARCGICTSFCLAAMSPVFVFLATYVSPDGVSFVVAGILFCFSIVATIFAGIGYEFW